MPQRSLYINGEKFYFKREPDYAKRLEIVNDLILKYPE